MQARESTRRDGARVPAPREKRPERSNADVRSANAKRMPQPKRLQRRLAGRR